MTADGRSADRLVIRRARPGDATGIGDVWLSSWRTTFDFPAGHPDDDVRRWLAEHLIPNTETWVAVDPLDGERVVGLMALSATMVEQLYVAPDWIGRGLGRRFIDLAKAERQAGLDLACFAANTFARRFYGRNGFTAVAFGDGSSNEEHQPDVRYAWRPTPTPSRTIDSADGTPIAVFTSGTGPPLLLVHGASADHTTFRVLGPRLAERFTLHAIDRRGRGASGDAPPYSIEREFEDVAGVAEALAAESGAPVPAFGHSYGGRSVLGAALLTEAIGRVVCYEGAPAPPGQSYRPAGIEGRLEERLRTGDPAAALAMFMTEIVGMNAADLDDFRANPVWPVRVVAAGTIPRELRAEASDAASLERLAAVRQPVLQLLGSASLPIFRTATVALDNRLADGRIVEIAGARHAAHHTHPDAVVDAVRAFLA